MRDMTQPTYKKLDELLSALDKGTEFPSALSFVQDGGEVIVCGRSGDVFRGSEQDVIAAFFSHYGIDQMDI